MFDKITIRAKVSDEECVFLAQLHHLHVWYSENDTHVEYRSGQYAKISGIDIKIARNTVTLKTSLHKYWNDRNYGRLRNDNVFTISEARSAFEMLLFENGLIAEKTRVVQFELGLNLDVTFDPLTYIEMVKFISFRDKLMFIDANYRINRQKTTAKYRDIRKYYKVYDKGWEMQDKKRGARYKAQGTGTDDEPKYILRIETVYRRHSERSDLFFREENINRLVKRFRVDWKDLYFYRNVRAVKGSRKSEIERAKQIINTGAEEYLQTVKEEYESGKMTAKQYRTIREFVRDYNEHADRFREIISPQERDYNELLVKVYNVSKN